MEAILKILLEYSTTHGVSAGIPILMILSLVWLAKYRIEPIHKATTKSILNEEVLQDLLDKTAKKSKIDHQRMIDVVEEAKKEILESNKELSVRIEVIDRSQLKTELKTDEILRTSKANKGGL